MPEGIVVVVTTEDVVVVSSDPTIVVPHDEIASDTASDAMRCVFFMGSSCGGRLCGGFGLRGDEDAGCRERVDVDEVPLDRHLHAPVTLDLGDHARVAGHEVPLLE
ncbi:MAG: hypothetical protein EBQ87_15555, partial [Planctomycetes bacterium]|nr:hypothetical protein [Planctomycetota bacterium]